MSRVTVVIEDHADGIHLGMQLAGGKVVAAMEGDYSDLKDAISDELDAALQRVKEKGKYPWDS